MDEIISSVAMGLGLFQMYDQVKNVEDIDINTKNAILLGLVTSCLWFVYQYRKYGLNMATLYASVSIIIQLYVLNKILLKEKKRE